MGDSDREYERDRADGRSKSRSRSRSRSRSQSRTRTRSRSPRERPRRPFTRPSRVLFVRGQPEHLTKAEFEEPWSSLPGYKSSRMLKHFSFVEFADVDAAQRAMRQMHGYRYPKSAAGRGLFVDYDRDNGAASAQEWRQHNSSATSDQPASAAPGETPGTAEGQQQQQAAGQEQQVAADPIPRSASPSPLRQFTPGAASSVPARPPSQAPAFPVEYAYASQYAYQQPAASVVGMGHLSRLTPAPLHPDTPSAVLCVTNLPRNPTQREIALPFRFMVGYRSCKLVAAASRDRQPAAYVEFTDTVAASEALRTLLGFRFDDEHSGLLISYERQEAQPAAGSYCRSPVSSGGPLQRRR
eukprot:m51a1_g712 hypothetical protein (355) ;mRNA; f:415500-417213